MRLGPGIDIPPRFEDAVREHEREIMRFVLRMTGDRDDALDLFQETWLRAYRAYPALKSAAGLRPWLFRIAANLCRNRRRDNARRARVITSMPEPPEGRAGSAAGESWERVIQLKRAVARLPHRQRAALAMRKFGGLDYRAIGGALGCSPESARANVYQALKKLQAER